MNSPETKTTWHATSYTVEQTVGLGAALALHLRTGDLIALIGELGAGKTQLVRGLAQGLGLAPSGVASPTFVMVHEYERNTEGQGPRAKGANQNPKSEIRNPKSETPLLVHIDAYRLKSLEDVESIGWDLSGPVFAAELRRNAVVVLEWADRIDAVLDDDRLEIRLTHLGPNDRAISMTPFGAFVSRWADLRPALETSFAPPSKCPICGKPATAPPVGRFFPFCSERCKLLDLGKWLGGQYAIPGSAAGPAAGLSESADRVDSDGD